MKTIILCGLLAALALVFVPPERSVAKQTEDVVLLIEESAAASALSAAPSADEPEARTVQLKTEDSVETVDEDTYLTAVVLSEMPASFEPEALAARRSPRGRSSRGSASRGSTWTVTSARTARAVRRGAARLRWKQNTAWSCRNTGTRRQPPLRRRQGRS